MAFHPQQPLAADTTVVDGFADPDRVQTEGRFTCPCGLPVIAAPSEQASSLAIWITPDKWGAWTLTDIGAVRFLPTAVRRATLPAERYRLHCPDCPAAVEARRREKERRKKELERQRRRGAQR